MFTRGTVDTHHTTTRLQDNHESGSPTPNQCSTNEQRNRCISFLRIHSQTLFQTLTTLKLTSYRINEHVTQLLANALQANKVITTFAFNVHTYSCK